MMDLTRVLFAGAALLAARTCRARTPLVGGVAIEHRCVFRCAFCEAWRQSGPVLETKQILTLVDEMAAAGTIRLTLTGGEPMLRRDIGLIVERCRLVGIAPVLNTSGHQVPDRIGELSGLARLTVSIEGRREVNDRVRGPGAFDTALRALDAARARGIRIRIATVLTRENLGEVAYLLDLGRTCGATVQFQPPTAQVLRGERPNPLVPSAGAYRSVIRALVDEKRRGNQVIANSLGALEYLSRYPDAAPMKCLAWRVAFRLDSAGKVTSCARAPLLASPPDAVRDGFAAAFQGVPEPLSCHGCWNAARLELNRLMLPDWRALVGAARGI